jgi:ribosome-associated translation inhibitor RaiA
MLLDDRFLKFQGFSPSDFTRTFLKDVLSELHEESPYGSTLEATFTKRENFFKGMVTIHSAVGKFFAIADGTQLKEVTHKLVDQIRKQLDRWKSKRFQRESKKEMAFNYNNIVSKEVNYDTNSVA